MTLVFVVLLSRESSKNMFYFFFDHEQTNNNYLYLFVGTNSRIPLCCGMYPSKAQHINVVVKGQWTSSASFPAPTKNRQFFVPLRGLIANSITNPNQMVTLLHTIPDLQF